MCILWKWKWSRSVLSDSSQPQGLQPTRLLCPWDFPGKSTGVGCHHLLQYTLKDMANYNSPIRHSDFPTQYLPEHILEDFQLGTMLEWCFYVDLGWYYEDSLKELCWIFSETVVSYVEIQRQENQQIKLEKWFSSVQFSGSVTSDSLQPRESQHASLPVHHQLPEFTQTHVHRVSDAIEPSHPLPSPSPPAPNPSQHQSLFQWVNSSHEVAKVLEFQL